MRGESFSTPDHAAGAPDKSRTRTRGADLAPVLLVDDDDDFRAIARRRIEAQGFEVVEARDGQEALDYLVGPPEHDASAFVLDLDMPTMSGWDLLPILASHVRLRSIPLVIVSAWPGDPRRLEPWRPTALLTKGEDLTRLCDVLVSLLLP